MSRRSAGFTLVELMVALVIIAVGVAAAAGLQLTSLRSSREAREINDVTRFVKNELEWQRHTSLDFDEIILDDCVSPRGELPDGYDSCVVRIEPCAINFSVDPHTLVCGPTSSAAAYRVTVEVEGPGDRGLSLSTLNTGVFVSGSSSEVLE